MTDQENYPIVLVCIFAVSAAMMMCAYVCGCLKTKRMDYKQILEQSQQLLV